MSITLPITDHLLFHGDCLEIMPQLPDKCVDMVLCDLPYGITQNKWDSLISLEHLWQQYDRLCNGPICLSACQPFSSALAMSNIDKLKYDWIWEKDAGTGFLNAKKQPLRSHEQILVFYTSQPTYKPQMEKGKPYSIKKGGLTSNYNPDSKSNIVTENKGDRYPKTVLRFSRDRPKIHPTQKPVALWEYLINTYTDKGAVVLDNCCGSGTTGVACVNTGRISIQIEQDEKYVQIAKQRLLAAEEALKCKNLDPATTQLPAPSQTVPTDSADPKELEP